MDEFEVAGSVKNIITIFESKIPNGTPVVTLPKPDRFIRRAKSLGNIDRKPIQLHTNSVDEIKTKITTLEADLSNFQYTKPNFIFYQSRIVTLLIELINIQDPDPIKNQLAENLKQVLRNLTQEYLPANKDENKIETIPTSVKKLRLFFERKDSDDGLRAALKEPKRVVISDDVSSYKYVPYENYLASNVLHNASILRKSSPSLGDALKRSVSLGSGLQLNGDVSENSSDA